MSADKHRESDASKRKEQQQQAASEQAKQAAAADRKQPNEIAERALMQRQGKHLHKRDGGQ
ncbi:MAG: hypothetical protein SH850_14495 [Planctomycetaceae bacterium]|nr:hypothetical protein [Planctomycetaceae bacterium]